MSASEGWDTDQMLSVTRKTSLEWLQCRLDQLVWLIDTQPRTHNSCLSPAVHSRENMGRTVLFCRVQFQNESIKVGKKNPNLNLAPPNYYCLTNQITMNSLTFTRVSRAEYRALLLPSERQRRWTSIGARSTTQDSICDSILAVAFL